MILFSCPHFQPSLKGSQESQSPHLGQLGPQDRAAGQLGTLRQGIKRLVTGISQASGVSQVHCLAVEISSILSKKHMVPTWRMAT